MAPECTVRVNGTMKVFHSTESRKLPGQLQGSGPLHCDKAFGPLQCWSGVPPTFASIRPSGRARRSRCSLTYTSRIVNQHVALKLPPIADGLSHPDARARSACGTSDVQAATGKPQRWSPCSLAMNNRMPSSYSDMAVISARLSFAQPQLHCLSATAQSVLDAFQQSGGEPSGDCILLCPVQSRTSPNSTPSTEIVAPPYVALRTRGSNEAGVDGSSTRHVVEFPVAWSGPTVAG